MKHARLEMQDGGFHVVFNSATAQAAVMVIGPGDGECGRTTATAACSTSRSAQRARWARTIHASP